MPSDAESVKAHLHSLVDELVAPLLSRASAGELTARTAEEETWRVVMELGRALLVAVWSACCLAITEAEVRERGWSMPGPGAEPGRTVHLRRDANYHADLNSTFGRVRVPWFAIRTPSKRATLSPAKSFFPHYPNMRSSDLLVEWECALAADHPFRKAADALLFFSHGATDVEDTTIERHAVAVGEAVPAEWLYLSPSQIREILETRAVRDLDTGRPLVCASTDAHALRRFVDDTWSSKWKMCNGIRLWTVDKDTGKTIHLGGEYIWGDCMAVRRRFEWLSERKILPLDGDYGDGLVAQVALITDGLDWIADYVLPLFPEGTVHVLDAYHVVQQVTEAARAAYPGKSNERRVRAVAKRARKALGFRSRRPRATKRTGTPKGRRQSERASGFDGSGERLLDDVLGPLLNAAKRGKKRIRQAIAYVERNLFRLDLGAIRTRGIPIGSGAMESLHRTGSQVRLKRAGCRWRAEVAQAILNLRMLALSGRWAEYWATPQLPHLAVQEGAA